MDETSAVTVGDATLYPSDLALLRPPCWFNDNLLTFFLEHLRLTRLNVSYMNSNSATRESSALASTILLVPPNITFFLSAAQSVSDVAAQLKPLCLQARSLVILLVNSASSPAAIAAPHDNSTAGDHWSVLVFDRQSSSFYAYDSLPDAPNESSARSIARTLIPFLRQERDIHPTIRIADMPGQENAYDCGPYACACVEKLVDFHLNKLPFGDERHSISGVDFPNFREKLRSIIAFYVAKTSRK